MRLLTAATAMLLFSAAPDRLPASATAAKSFSVVNSSCFMGAPPPLGHPQWPVAVGGPAAMRRAGRSGASILGLQPDAACKCCVTLHVLGEEFGGIGGRAGDDLAPLVLH